MNSNNEKITAAAETAAPITDIGLLDPKECNFYVNPNGFTALQLGERNVKRVKLARTLPYSQPFSYICVFDTEDNEIGIIKDVDELAAESAALVKKELDNRYYCPQVTQIISIKEKLGYFYFDVMIGEHKKVFAVKDISRNIKQLDENRIIIFDVDGNRYYIADIWSIDKSSRRKIEPYLY
ncbi:MAG: DUF1854 domain-containing protein [Oscillospiraceae bacterium]|nr:DUF1854 domain-containing protein [Oscillospiraceae bacterium]